MLRVHKDGEHADLLSQSELPGQPPLEERLAEFHGATTAELSALGNIATVDDRNKITFISITINPNRLAIAGLVMHTNAEDLAALNTFLPHVPMQVAEG